MWTLEPAGLDLRRTLDSGQAFRWRWEDGHDGGPIATGIVGRHRVRITQDQGGIHLFGPVTGGARAAIARYLGLGPGSGSYARRAGTPATADGGAPGGVRDRPRSRPHAAAGAGLARIEAALAADRVLARVIPHTRGTGLLIQDPWEVLISFIVSQNNNIPKISRSIDALARALGDPVDETGYAFPPAERLAAAPAGVLRACHLGYRAPYVRAAARLVASGRLDLAALGRMPEEEARETLRAVPGIGDKVADCILLFGLGHTTAFPVDVWVWRAMERLYFEGRPRPLRDIRAFARARFGPLAGYAQQHLFTYAREHLRPRGAHVSARPR